ncbi:MAG: hypothetical protein QXP70_02685 [Methanomassiliicoccales archaeon]
MIPFFFPSIVALSFGPALALMYFSLARYTYPKVSQPLFDDRWVFGLMAAGIIVGTIFYYLEVRTLNIAGGIISLILFLLVQELIVLVILNFPRIRKMGASRYYGYALGTAVAAGFALGQYGVSLGGKAGVTPEAIAILLLYTFGVELIGGATGSIIGYYIEERRIPIGLVTAVILQFVFNLVVLPVFLFRPSTLTALLDAAGLLISIVVYFYSAKRILPFRPQTYGIARKRVI